MRRSRSLTLLSIGAAILFAIAIAYPTLSVAREALLVDGQLTWENVEATMADPGLVAMTRNTVVLTLGGALIGMVFGTTLAVTTTLLPSGRFTRSLMLMAPLAPLTIPPLVGAVGWLFLLAPRSGWLNVLARWITGDTSGEGPLSVYSMPVAVWVVGLYVVPYVYTVMASSISRLSSEILEAYQVNGLTLASAFGRSIAGPLRPAALAAFSLAVVQSLSQFSVPLILQWDVLTTYLHRNTSLLGYTGRAAVVGLPLLSIALVFSFMQLQLMRRGNRWATVSGRGSGVREVSFGKTADRLLKLGTCGYLAVAGVLPLGAIALVSLLRYWRPQFTMSDLSLQNYGDMATNAFVQDGVINSFVLALSCALAATLLAFGIVLLMERVGNRPAKAAYFFANLPLGFPNVLLGLGFLFAFIRPPIVLYGTLSLLIVAYLVAFLPISVRNLGPLVQQIGVEMEEAAVVSGTSWFGAIRKVTLPLIMPGFTASTALLFVLIFREFPMAAFLSTSGTRVISMSLLSYHASGQWSYVAVIAIGLSAISAFGIAISQFISRRYSITARQRSTHTTAPVVPGTASVGDEPLSAGSKPV